MRKILLLLSLVSLCFGAGLASAQDGGETVYTVQANDTLYRIAQRFNISVQALAERNAITDPNLIYAGQQLHIPRSSTPASPAASGGEFGTGGAMPAPVSPPQNLAPTLGFSYGVQVFGSDAGTLVAPLNQLGATWVKLRVDWSRYEATQGQINFEALDALITPLNAANLNILLTLTGAPAWARDSQQENGPPTQNADFANFASALASRYAGRVQAYEIWTTPNLRREWNGRAISGAAYVALLQPAYEAIKLSDPAAIVVSAGLAPTAISDAQTAVDDRAFLRQFYAAGGADFADAIGVMPLGWANPPDSSCCMTRRPTVTGWDDNASFFFLETLREYRAIMVANGDDGTFLWVTGFGWGTADDLAPITNPDQAYIGYNDAQEQAQYTVRAFTLGRDLTYVGPMFLDNLNACDALGADQFACYFSLIGPNNTPRPAFNALAALPK